MKIVIASDHGGLRLKNEIALELARAGHAVDDLGTKTDASTDYPDFAHAVAKLVGGGSVARGILVCGTGIGMSIAANRHPGVRAVVCSDTYTARLSRDHNDSNILCIGERVVGPGLAWEIVSTWLAEPASTNERHVRRRTKIEL
ncbi:MAG: ribose 5-phosphate isomerase B [Labilithrix sp.]|nr:ribose 5-phosphate isomerase B [Labilithrix sp.]MBX3218438.1 ribose 5-phosphate isomerase B [Labilithrix sp.]